MNLPRLIVIVVLLAVVTVPTAAVSVTQSGGSTDQVNWEGPAVSLSPSEGENGEYATVENGEVVLEFEDLNDEARTRFDNVFTITSEGDETAEIWVTSDADAVHVYRDDDPDDWINSSNRSISLKPGDSIAVGAIVDSTSSVPNTSTVTIHSIASDDEESEEPDQQDEEETDTDDDQQTDTDDETDTDDDQDSDDTQDTDTDDEQQTDDAQSDVRVIELTGPEQVAVNQTVTFEATLRNFGNATGTRTLSFGIDGTVTTTKSVTVPADETRTVGFEHTFQQSGEYNVTVSDESATRERMTTVVEGESAPAGDPNIEITDTRIEGDRIEPGDSSTVIVTVQNTGDTDGTREVELSSAGVVVETRTVRVPAGGTRTITFDRTFEEAGIYPIEVSGVETGEVRVDSGNGMFERGLPSSVGTLSAGVGMAWLAAAIGMGRSRRKIIDVLQSRI